MKLADLLRERLDVQIKTFGRTSAHRHPFAASRFDSYWVGAELDNGIAEYPYLL